MLVKRKFRDVSLGMRKVRHNPVVTGSDRPTNTIGIVRVKSRNARAVGVLVATSTSGAIAISSRA
jgi:hypothetical protein